MADKFKMGVNIPAGATDTTRLGSAADAGGRLADTELGKFVGLAGESQYDLSVVGDPVEGIITAREPATQDGWTIGSVGKAGRIGCICDGLQATPGTGTVTVGSYVVVGTPIAKATAITRTGGVLMPKVCKATLQPGTEAAGIAATTIAIPIELATITGAGDVLTDYTPGYKFKLLSIDFAVSNPVTTASKLASLHAEIGATATTGGVVALTSANATPLGEVEAGSAITALNTGSASDTVSIVASSVTAFTEGTGYLLLKIQNLDTQELLNSLNGANNLEPGWRVVSLGVAGAVGDTCIIEKAV